MFLNPIVTEPDYVGTIASARSSRTLIVLLLRRNWDCARRTVTLGLHTDGMHFKQCLWPMIDLCKFKLGMQGMLGT